MHRSRGACSRSCSPRIIEGLDRALRRSGKRGGGLQAENFHLSRSPRCPFPPRSTARSILPPSPESPASSITRSAIFSPSLSRTHARSEEHTSELQSLMRISYAVFCLKKKTKNTHTRPDRHNQRGKENLRKHQ